MNFYRFAMMSLMCGLLCAPVWAQKSSGNFDPPVFLKVGDQPMNADGEMMYPSPALIDIDNDGRTELVIGTIFGSVYACENSSEANSDPVWEAPTIVNTVDGEPLRLNNW